MIKTNTTTAGSGKKCETSRNSEGIGNFFLFLQTYHSWERGANENANGFVRKYIPKGTDFCGITDEFVAWVEN